MSNLTIEDGSGIWEANAYAGVAYVSSYLAARGKLTAWDALSLEAKVEAIVKATDYIDRRFGHKFKGRRQHTDLTVNAFNYVKLAANPHNNDELKIGDVTYRFRNSISAAYDINIGSTKEETNLSLVAAINLTGTEGVEYGAGTLIHPDITATACPCGQSLLKAVAKIEGAAANDTVAFSATATTRITFDYTTLQNGSDSAEQRLEWPRLYVYNRNNQLVTGIPEKLRQATAEYAWRAASATLMPDPTTDETGQLVVRTFDKVGPIETEREYVAGSAIAEFKKYPEADRLLLEYINAGGGVIR